MRSKSSQTDTAPQLSAPTKSVFLVLTVLFAALAIVIAPSVFRGTFAVRGFSSFLVRRITNRPTFTASSAVMGDKMYSPKEEREWNKSIRLASKENVEADRRLTD